MTAHETPTQTLTKPTHTSPTASPNGTANEPDPRLLNAEGQTFLVGDHLYLRGLELSDAKHVRAWHTSPFPVSPERAEELLKELQSKSDPWYSVRKLVVCRRSDGLPVGSVTYSVWAGRLSADVSIHVDYARPDADELKAGILVLMHDWLLKEREFMSYALFVRADEPRLQAATERLGLRQAGRWREKLGLNGQRLDELCYEGLHPKWVERLGDPGPGIEHVVAVDDPKRWRPRERPLYGEVTGDPPKNAIMVGPRVYLRSLEEDDAELVTIASRREPETFFDDGRRPKSTIAYRNHISEVTKAEIPEWIRFMVCLRENDKPIGVNGLLDISWAHRTGETESWFFDPDYRNQGYGSEAKHLLLAYLFERLNMHMVISYVWGPNGRSAAALRKQGYRDAGRFNWDGTKDGDFTYATTFDLLADEWRELNGR